MNIPFKSGWGPHFWYAIDATVGNAPENVPQSRRQLYKQFLVDNLCELLPCSHCRHSWQEYTSMRPIEAYWDTRGGLQYWTWINHNAVNQKLNKNGINFFDYISRVENMRAKCSGKKGMKGCTDPAVEKSSSQCRDYANEIWEKYANIDIDAFKRTRQTNQMITTGCQIAIASLVSLLVLRIITRLTLHHKNSSVIKFIAGSG